jgi:DNA-binding winged helix-turn-helix (wHTH) protein
MMAHLDFHPGEYSVTFESEKIYLLGKEYALLHFLYRHKNQTFTRDELLDHVWKMEAPIPRTVDDHIYRLRKKLASWNHFLTIYTVRGYGYRLTLKTVNSMKTPSLYDAEITNHANKLFQRFHLFGQGRSIRVLSEQQEALGIEVDPLYRVFVHFLQLDMQWLLETDEVPFELRLYFLLGIYQVIHFDAAKSLYYFEKVLEKGILPSDQHTELEILNILDVYVEMGFVDKAMERLKVTHRVVEENGWESFVDPVAIAESYVYLLAGEVDKAAEVIAKTEKRLISTPYLREIGALKIIKGLLMLKQGHRTEAKVCLDEGLDVLRQSQIVPMLIWSIHKVLFFLKRHGTDHELHRKYEKMWDDLTEQFSLDEWKGKMEKQLDQYLFSV